MHQDICGVQFLEVMILVDKHQLIFHYGMLIMIMFLVFLILLPLLDGKHQVSSSTSEQVVFVEQVLIEIGILDYISHSIIKIINYLNYNYKQISVFVFENVAKIIKLRHEAFHPSPTLPKDTHRFRYGYEINRGIDNKF